MRRSDDLLSQRSGGFWQAVYFVILLLVSFPSKFLFYTAAPVAATLMAFAGPFKRNCLLSVLAITIFEIFSLLLNPQIAVLPALLWPFTYGFFLLLIYKFACFERRVPSKKDLQALLQLITYWTILQAIIGIAQYLISKNPDAVAGTVGLLDFRGNITVNQVYFGFATLSLLPAIATMPYRLRFRRTAVTLGLLAVILSQSGHASAAFLVAAGVIYALTSWKLKRVLTIMSLFSLLSLGIMFLYPSTPFVAYSWFSRTTSPDSPKVLVVRETVHYLTSDIKMLIFGAGPGQYISKAALTGSGLLTRWHSPLQKIPYRLADLKFIFDVYSEKGEGSAISKPYNSYISIFSELGVIVGSLFIIIILGTFAVSFITSIMSKDQEVKSLAQYVAFYVFFLLLVSLIELYFEMPAAIGPGGWLAVAAFTRMRALALSLGAQQELTLYVRRV